MLDIKRMTQGDAQHTLEVFQWIKVHLQEITAKALNAEEAGLCASDMQPTFHETYTELECTRFLPVTIAIFTNEDTLERGEATEPNVLLSRPEDQDPSALVGHLHTLELSEVTALFGIDGNCPTWRVSQGHEIGKAG